MITPGFDDIDAFFLFLSVDGLALFMFERITPSLVLLYGVIWMVSGEKIA